MKQQLATLLVLSFVVGMTSVLPTTSTAQTTSVRSSSTAGMPSDSDLSAMARRSLEQDSSFSSEARNVHIKVKNGRASLHGSVNSLEEKAAIRNKVMAVEGVKSVDDQLQIRE